MKSKWKKWNLQLFAEEPEQGTEGGAEDAQEPEDGGDPGAGSEPPAEQGEKLYTKKELDDAIREAQEEAEKLAKMNAVQRQKYELEKAQREKQELKDKVARLEKEAMRSELSKTAARIMKEQHNVVATQDMLDFVVGEDAEQTNQRIAKLIGIIQEDRRQIEEARATGRTPKSFHNNGNTMSEIDKRIAKYQ